MSARETGDLPTCVLCGSLNGIIDRQVMPLSITRGPGHRELWSVMACERCAVAIVENNSKGTGAQVHAPLPNIDPYDDDAHLVDVVLRDLRFARAIDKYAPLFAPKVRVKLPERLPIEPVMRPETFERRTTYNQAVEACAAAIRAAGAEIEGEPDVS